MKHIAERKAEELWLAYFNQTLYKKGYLTQTEFARLSTMIKARPQNAKRSLREKP